MRECRKQKYFGVDFINIVTSWSVYKEKSWSGSFFTKLNDRLFIRLISKREPRRNRLEVNTTFIEPGSPWENGYIESFNGKMRDELLNGEMFDTMFEARILIERWRHEYYTIRPHSSLGYRPSAPVAILPTEYRCCKNSPSSL